MKDLQIKQISKFVEKKDFFKNKKKVFRYLKDEETRDFFLEKLPRVYDNVECINYILEDLLETEFPYAALEILQNSISKVNNPYILRILRRYHHRLNKKNSFIEYTLVEILETILLEDEKMFEALKEYVSKVISLSKKEGIEIQEKFDIKFVEFCGKLFEVTFKKYSSNPIKLRGLLREIAENFTVINDEADLLMESSVEIYKIFQSYINLDFNQQSFQKRVAFVVNLVNSQFDKTLRTRKFGGWDLWGSGIGQFGGDFSIHDKSIVNSIFEPAFLNQYKHQPDLMWEYIKLDVLEKRVSRSNPDYLKRSVVWIVLEKLKERKMGAQEIEILINLIQEREGVPVKADFIFQYLSNNLELFDEELLLSLAEADLKAPWNKHNIPSNIFVEKIIADLAKKNNKKAISYLEVLLENNEYLKSKKRRDYGLFFLLSGILKSNIDQKDFFFRKFLFSILNNENIGISDIYDISGLFADFIENNKEQGMLILREVISLDTLSEEQQSLVGNILNRFEGKDNSLLEFGYELIVEGEKKKLFKSLSARELLARFSEILAKAKQFDKSLVLIRIFLEDERSPRRGDYMWESFEKGEDVNSINTVRGWSCWAMSHFVVTEGRDYIPEIIQLVKKVSMDDHPYVRQMACFPLSNLAKYRYSKTPEKIRFISDDDADLIQDIAFQMLKDERNWKYKSLMKGLVYVFANIRALKQEEVRELFDVFTRNLGKDVEDFVLPEVVPLLLFFAELRGELFVGWKFKHLGRYSGLPFRERLIEIISNKSTASNVRLRLASQIENVIKEDLEKEKNSLKKYGKYINALLQKYDHIVFMQLYEIVEAGIDTDFSRDYFSLFLKILNKERQNLNKNSNLESRTPMARHYFHIGDTLVAIKKRLGDETFLRAFNSFVNITAAFYVSSDIKLALQDLGSIKNKDKEVLKIYRKLAKNNSFFQADYLDWKLKVKKDVKNS